MTKVYQLHPVVQQAYSDVHSWLAGRPAANGYMDIRLREMRLDCPSMKHVAAQFALLFHAHHFKSSFILNEILTHERLASWLSENQHITLIDMGCGAGAASAALTATLIELIEAKCINHEITLVCIGVDFVDNVLGIYNKLMEGLQERVKPYGVELETKVVDRPASESVIDLDVHLQGFLQEWNQPALSQVIVAQSNIVRPLSALFDKSRRRRSRLLDLEVPPTAFLQENKFGIREVRSFRQLFVQLPIDNLHILTVGTNEDLWLRRVEEMGDSVTESLLTHDVKSYGTCLHGIHFVNPAGSHWRARKQPTKYSRTKFVTDVRSVENTELAGDTHWHRIISIDNLELAWARVRLIRTRDAINDEIEIRLFERDLDVNLERLHSKLNSYEKNVAKTDDRLSYSFPKGDDDKRPYVLPRIEEDILAVAAIQVLGKLAFGLQNTSYAYRPHESFPRSTEFLYRNWFDAFRRFRDDVWIGVSLEGNCKILETDIESYYKCIDQRKLVDTVASELRTQSTRVTWLLEKLFLVCLEDHVKGHGLAQGAAGSGFYANTFLAGLDSEFGQDDSRFYRYMDDIYLVIPENGNLTDFKSRLDNKLKSFGLKRNCKKTTSYDSNRFRQIWDTMDELEDISNRFTFLTNCLWYANEEYRTELQRTDSWWDVIDRYRNQLRSLEIYVEADRLSRKMHQYFSRRKRNNDCRSGLVKELKYPPQHATEWTSQFVQDNCKWIGDRDSVREDLIRMLNSSYCEIQSDISDKRKKQLTTNIVFCANNLQRLGFAGIDELLTEILTERSTIIRQPRHIIRSLADQGFYSAVSRLITCFADSDHPAAPYYLSLATESVRFLPEKRETFLERIANIALDICRPAIVRLKATETLVWASIGNSVLDTERIRNIMHQETSTRLKKNYMLLLGSSGYNVEYDIESGDYLLQSANRIASQDEILKLFDCVEPEILRKKYYGWEYSDGPREHSEMGYY